MPPRGRCVSVTHTRVGFAVAMISVFWEMMGMVRAGLQRLEKFEGSVGA